MASNAIHVGAIAGHVDVHIAASREQALLQIAVLDVVPAAPCEVARATIGFLRTAHVLGNPFQIDLGPGIPPRPLVYVSVPS